MQPLASRINPSDDTFRANRDRMQSLVQQLRDRLNVARQGGGPKYLQRHRDQGKLPVRERIELLLDPGSPFLELSPLAAFEMYDGDAPASSPASAACRDAKSSSSPTMRR
jgi:acetyl-CoA carboxylase carboxyltransferase component